MRWPLFAVFICYALAAREGEDIARLRRWAINRGAWINPNLRIVPVDAMGRGLVTLRRLVAGDQLFYIPRMLWLSDDQAKLLLEEVLTPSQQKAIADARAAEPPGCTPNPWFLTLIVLLLSKPATTTLPSTITEWEPLVGALPTECVGEVCGKTKAKKKESDREAWIRKCLGTLHGSGTKLTASFVNQGVFGDVKATDMHWALSMVTSRLQVISEEDPPMLVPFLDSLNCHSFDECCSSSPAHPPVCESDDDDATCVEIDNYLTNYTAKRDFKAGAQLFEVYGDLTRLELSLLFGFFPPSDEPVVRMAPA